MLLLQQVTLTGLNAGQVIGMLTWLINAAHKSMSNVQTEHMTIFNKTRSRHWCMELPVEKDLLEILCQHPNACLQVLKVRQLLRDSHLKEVRIGTVDDYQGQASVHRGLEPAIFLPVAFNSLALIT